MFSFEKYHSTLVELASLKEKFIDFEKEFRVKNINEDEQIIDIASDEEEKKSVLEETN